MNKAKIKKRIVYSVLFMRDDSDVLRFRMSAFWLKFFVYFIILLFAVSAGASFLSYHYWRKTVVLESRIMTQEAQLKPLQEQMGRLDRLSSFAQAIDSQPPGELRPILQEMGNSNATTKSQPEADLLNGGAVNGSQSNSTKSVNGTDAASLGLTASNATSAGQPTGLSEANAENQMEAKTNGTASESSAVANDELKVNNFVARFSGRNKLRINFDLNNIDTQRSISGQVRVSLLDSSQQVVAIKPDKDNTGFKITFSKEFALIYSLPEGMGASSVSGFLLEVEDSSGAVIHSEQFAPPAP